MTSKRTFKFFVACCVVVLGLFPMASQAAKPLVWKAASIYATPVNEVTNSKGLALKKFAQMVEERSQGRMKIEIYWNAVLGGSMEIFDLMRMGELELFFGQPMATSDKRFGVWSVPYLFTTEEEVIRIACDPNGKMFKLADKWIGENDGKLLAIGLAGLRGFVNSQKVIKRPEDLKGLKCRVYQDPVVNLFWEGLCNASPLPLSELYTSMQTRTVDGSEFQATGVLTYKLYEVGKYFSDIDWQWVSNANMIASKQHWEALPDDLKVIVSGAAIEAMQFQSELEPKFVTASYKDLQDKGVSVYRLSPEDREVWEKYARSLDNKMRAVIGPEAYDEVLNIIKEAKAAK